MAHFIWRLRLYITVKRDAMGKKEASANWGYCPYFSGFVRELYWRENMEQSCSWYNTHTHVDKSTVCAMWDATSKFVIFVFLPKSTNNVPKNTLMALDFSVVNVFSKIIFLCNPNIECKSYQLHKMSCKRSASNLITSISSSSLLAPGCFEQGRSVIRLFVHHDKCMSTCTFLAGLQTPISRQKFPHNGGKCTRN